MYPKTILDNMRYNGPIESRKYNHLLLDKNYDINWLKGTLTDLKNRMTSLQYGQHLDALNLTAKQYVED